MKKTIGIKITAVLCAILLLTGCQSTGAVIKTQEGLKDTIGTVDKDTKQEEHTDPGQNDGSEGEAIKEEGSIQPGNQGITVNKIIFEVLEIENLSEQIRNEIEVLKLQKGYEFWQQEDGSYLIMIGAGEKLTGGYGIEVEAVEDNEGKTVISVIEHEPVGDMNLQALTYPFVVIKAAGIADRFLILDQEQNEYPHISAEGKIEGEDSGLFDTVLRLSEDFENPVIGIYQGQIDNHSIEVLVGEAYMVFTADDMDQYIKGLQSGDQVEVIRTVSPSDQVMLERIIKLN